MTAVGIPFAVEDSSQVGGVRRAAIVLAQYLRFDEAGAGRVALVASELASNLAKHARGGHMLLRATETDLEGGRGVDILALDRGPGFADVARSRTDGFSTTGTLGQGLGAIERQSDLVDVYTTPGGTAILARLLVDRRAAPRPRVLSGGVRVNAPGERVCGDDLAIDGRGDRVVVLVADGLGHGLAAHDAATRAVTVFRSSLDRQPIDIVHDVHAGLRGTRGAAVTVVALELDRRIARCCGVGNVSAVVLPPGTPGRHSMISHNGTAGHGVLRPVERQYPFPPQSLLVLHTDGLQSQWDLAAYPGVRAHHPTLIAGLLYRDFSRQRDDVTVVVVKEYPPR